MYKTFFILTFSYILLSPLHAAEPTEPNGVTVRSERYERKSKGVNVGPVGFNKTETSYSCVGNGCTDPTLLKNEQQNSDENKEDPRSIFCLNCTNEMGFNAGSLGFTARLNDKTWGDPRANDTGKARATSQTYLVNLFYRGINYSEREITDGGDAFYDHDQSSSMDFGGTASQLNDTALEEFKRRPKHGFAFGITHHDKESFGVATDAPFGVYGKTHFGLDIVAHTLSNAEGNHLIANAGFSAGLDVKTKNRKFRFLAGPLIQGLLGVQTLGTQSRFVGQIQVGAETTLLFQTIEGIFVALRGQYAQTLLVETFGGNRKNWRAGIDISKQSKRNRFKKIQFFVGAIYTGNQIQGLPFPNNGNLDMSGERRNNHTFMGRAGIHFK